MSVFAPLYQSDNPTILRIWRYLAIITAALFVHSLLRFFLGEVLALYLAIGSAVFFALAFWLSRHQDITPLREALQGWHWVIFMLLALLGIFLGSREERDLLYIHASLLYWPFAFLFYSQIYHESKQRLSIKLLLSLLALLVVFIAVVRVLGLSYYPRYQWVDEPWIYSWIINYFRTGRLEDTLYHNIDVDIHYLVTYPMAYWLSLAEPSLWFARLYNFILFWPFSALLALAAYYLYDKRTAFFTFLAALGCGSLYGSVHFRHDLSFMTFIALALAAYAYALKSNKALWHGIAGLITGLSLYAHFHAMGMGPMLVLGLYLPLYLAKRRGEYAIPYSHVIAFMAGGLLGAGIVFVTVLLPNWETVSAVRIGVGWLGVTDPLQLAKNYIFYIYIARQFLFEQLLSFGALALLFVRREPKDNVLITLFFLGPALVGFLSAGSYPHYIQHVAFIYALVIGRGISIFLDWFPFKQQSSLLLALGCLILAPMIGSITPFFVIEEQRPLLLQDPASVTWIKENVPEGSVIVAPNWYALFLYEDYTVYSVHAWNVMREDEQASVYNNDAALYWDEINPAVIITWQNIFRNRPNDIEAEYMLSRDYELHVFTELSPMLLSDVEVKLYVQPTSP